MKGASEFGTSQNREKSSRDPRPKNFSFVIISKNVLVVPTKNPNKPEVDPQVPGLEVPPLEILLPVVVLPHLTQ